MHQVKCHCEERSDEAISQNDEIATALRASQRLRRIAALPSVARNDRVTTFMRLY